MSITQAVERNPYILLHLIFVGVIFILSIVGIIVITLVGDAVPTILTVISVSSFTWFTGASVTGIQLKP